MCGRFIDPDWREAGSGLAGTAPAAPVRRFNIKPTDPVLVVTAGGALHARWGLVPHWHRGTLKDWKAATINARIEEAAGKPSFRGPWRHGRCLIPAGGYYEWTGSRTPRQPHVFEPAGNEPVLWFAGLLSLWQDLPTCAIVTRAANDCVEPLHDRMPVILDTEEREAWLAGRGDASLGARARVRHRPVRRFGLQDEGPALLD